MRKLLLFTLLTLAACDAFEDDPGFTLRVDGRPVREGQPMAWFYRPIGTAETEVILFQQPDRSDSGVGLTIQWTQPVQKRRYCVPGTHEACPGPLAHATYRVTTIAGAQALPTEGGEVIVTRVRTDRIEGRFDFWATGPDRSVHVEGDFVAVPSPLR